MKAIIEHVLISDIILSKEINSEFVSILNKIQLSKTENDLRDEFRFDEFKHFKIGFGSSHMWVKQNTSNGLVNERLIFVQF